MDGTPPCIAVLGSINLDLVVRCGQLPRPGQTITADSLAQVPGGKGANQAVAAARLEAEVQMIGRVGDDGFADVAMQSLKTQGVGVDHVRQTAGPTGVAIVSVEDSGENAIVVVPGANARLSPEDVESARPAIAASQALLLQLEVPLETVTAAADLARREGVMVFLDPAPAVASLPDVLHEVDVICPNQTEAAALLGRPVETREQAEAAAAQLHARGPGLALVTLGADGVVFAGDEGQGWVASPCVEAVDTTAAGDSFAAALAVRLAQGDGIEHALRFACAAGAAAAMRHGAQTGLPTIADVEKLFGD